MALTKEELIYLARIAEQGERFDEMIDFVKEILKFPTDMTPQERNLLSVCYKNAVSKRRTSLRILDNYEIKDDRKQIQTKKILLSKCRSQVDTELKNLCFDAVDTVNFLLSRSQDSENHVFLLKMKADYYRYMSEYDKAESRLENVSKAEEYYVRASELSESISAVNPIRLGLMLNFSVFYYEIKGEKEAACEMARKAFDAGLAELDQTNEANYKEATMILQLFRDNLSLWA